MTCCAGSRSSRSSSGSCRSGRRTSPATDFYSNGHFDTFSDKIQDRIRTHQGYARTLRWITTGFAAVTVLATWLHGRTGPARTVLGLLVVAGAVLTLIWVALTGEAGARAVWGT